MDIAYSKECIKDNLFRIHFMYKDREHTFKMRLPQNEEQYVSDCIVQMEVNSRYEKLESKYIMDKLAEYEYAKYHGLPTDPEMEPKYTLADLEEKMWGDIDWDTIL